MIAFRKIFVGALVFLIIFFLIIIIFGAKIIDKEKEANQVIVKNSDISEINFNSISSLRSIDDTDIIVGSLGAKVEIIIYEDLSDFYSVKLNEALMLVKENFSNNVVIAFRPYVVRSFPLSYPVYSLLECAKEQGAFFEMRKIILEQVDSGEIAEINFDKYILSSGVNFGLADKCINDKKYYSKIENLSREAEGFGVYGSPVIFVNKEMIVGARSFEDVVNGEGEKFLGLRSIVARHLRLDILESNLLEEVVCAMDVRECVDGSYVGRDSKNNCDFSPCLIDDPVACTMDAKICPDGSAVGRDGKNNCEFFSCP